MERIIGYKLKNDMSDSQLYRTGPREAGLDIRSSDNLIISARTSCIVNTGLFIELFGNVVGIVKSRSGLSVKHNIEVGAGVIDASYRGEIKVKLYNHGNEDFTIHRGDRIAQLLVMPVVLGCFEEVDELSDSERGENGIGSSGVE